MKTTQKLVIGAIGAVAVSAGFAAMLHLTQGPSSDEPATMYATTDDKAMSVKLRWSYVNPLSADGGVILVREDEKGKKETLGQFKFSDTVRASPLFRTAVRQLKSAVALTKPVVKDTATEFQALRSATQVAIASKEPAQFEAKLAKALSSSAPIIAQRAKIATVAKVDLAVAQQRGQLGAASLSVQRAKAVSAGQGRGGGVTQGSAVKREAIQPPINQRRVAEEQDVTAVTDEDVIDARGQLTAEAMMTDFETAAKEYGQAFEDRKVEAKAHYKYRLIKINGNKEIGSIDVRVGDNLPLMAPKFEPVAQLGQRLAGLHFSLPAGIDDVKYGLLKFQVSRTDSRGSKLLDDNVMTGYSKSGANELSAGMVTFTDDDAPVSGAVEYRVRIEDLFGRLGPEASSSLTMKDLTTPLAVDRLSAIRTGNPAGTQFQVKLYWFGSALDSEERALLPNAVTYKVTRRDDETGTTQDLTGATIAPIDSVPVLALYELDSNANTMIQVQAEWVATNGGRGDKPIDETEIQSQLEKLKAMTVGQLRAVNPVFTTNLLKDLPLASLFTLVDTAPTPDSFTSYTVTPTLVLTQLSGSTTASDQVGIPASTMPGAPTMGAFTDEAARTAGSVLIAGKSMSNVVKLQPNVGMRGPSQVAINSGFTAQEAPAQAATRMIGISRAALPPAAALRTATRTSGGGELDPLELFAQVGGKPVLSGAKATAVDLTAVTPLAPMNYGRMVTLTWNAPTYKSPLSYKVYRAIGTGYVTPKSASAKPKLVGPGAKVAIGGVARNKVAVGGVATAQVGKARAARLQTAISREGITVSQGKERVYYSDVEPADSEYELLGETKKGETEFIDLIPRSQSSTYYYYVVPTNRWGQSGASATPKKIRVLPSMPPNTPTLAGLSTAKEADPTATAASPTPIVRLTVLRNLDDEMVTAYEIYRLETAAPPPMTQSAAPSGVPASQGPVRADLSQRAPKAATYGIGKPVANASGAAVARSLSGLSARTAQMSAAAVGGATAAALDKLQSTSTTQPTEFTLVATVPVTAGTDPQFEMTDRTVEAGKSYVYYVRAVNTVALKSGASTVLDVTAAMASALPPTLLQKGFDEDAGVVQIKITKGSPSTRAYLVRRATGTGEFAPLGSIPAGAGNDVVYEDITAIAGRTYRYEFTAVDVSGNASDTKLIVQVP